MRSGIPKIITVAMVMLFAQDAFAQNISIICDATFSGSSVDQTSGTYGFTFQPKNKLLTDSHGNRFAEVEVSDTEVSGKRVIVSPENETRGVIMHVRINRNTSRFEVGLTYADGKDTTGSKFYDPNYMFDGKPQQRFQTSFGTCRTAKNLF
ncbi:hypothetical protein HUE56_04530 (plasmid) [Azospirillum oryzae]|uniref:Uncharacterized protein n=1 Tax=Azospirillum oryzae TaxID=286727 RepID=A0A6N1ADQ8_9PROT|nr:hypothetical protein [Azospirillum oryzae]KAA0584512.1 hypothetical protein FZ938_29520 [Azospirillum oryzae]QKS49805.1 hypothetical protein HUE56_04530 [Azospirillum oryzae]